MQRSLRFAPLEALRRIVGGANMTTPGGAGTRYRYNFLRARQRTGFSHRVGVPHHTGLRPFFLLLFTGVRGMGILRSSHTRSSEKFVRFIGALEHTLLWSTYIALRQEYGAFVT